MHRSITILQFICTKLKGVKHLYKGAVSLLLQTWSIDLICWEVCMLVIKGLCIYSVISSSIWKKSFAPSPLNLPQSHCQKDDYHTSKHDFHFQEGKMLRTPNLLKRIIFWECISHPGRQVNKALAYLIKIWVSSIFSWDYC